MPLGDEGTYLLAGDGKYPDSLSVSESQSSSVKDRIGIYSQISICSKRIIIAHVKRYGKMVSPLKFQQLNSELSHMKHSQKLSKSDLQVVKIRLVFFLGMFHV